MSPLQGFVVSGAVVPGRCPRAIASRPFGAKTQYTALVFPPSLPVKGPHEYPVTRRRQPVQRHLRVRLRPRLRRHLLPGGRAARLSGGDRPPAAAPRPPPAAPAVRGP